MYHSKKQKLILNTTKYKEDAAQEDDLCLLINSSMRRTAICVYMMWSAHSLGTFVDSSFSLEIIWHSAMTKGMREGKVWVLCSAQQKLVQDHQANCNIKAKLYTFNSTTA